MSGIRKQHSKEVKLKVVVQRWPGTGRWRRSRRNTGCSSKG